MTGPDPAVAAVRSAVRTDLADLADLGGPADPADIPRGPRPLVLVACSGGGDSLALAAGTAFAAAALGLRAGAVVIDHGWSPSSAGAARAAATACRRLGLDPVEVVAVDAAPAAGGPEAAAREARYALLDAAAGRAGATAVLLGHTADDQAETVLLGLARGSGTRSLAGMAAVRGRYRRPLLGLDRATTHRCCAALGLSAAADPANADPRYARARVRHRVLPVLERELGPGVARALARTAAAARRDADLLDDLAADLHGRVTGVDGALDCAALAPAPPALLRRVLRAAAVAAGSPAGSLAAGHVDAVEKLVTAWHGQAGVDLPGSLTARRRDGRLTIGRTGQQRAL